MKQNARDKQAVRVREKMMAETKDLEANCAASAIAFPNYAYA